MKRSLLIYCLLLLCICTFSCTYYDREDANENFVKNKHHIYDLINYINQKKPKNSGKGVAFSFGDSKNTFNLAIRYEDGSVIQNDPNIVGHNISRKSPKMDTLLTMLGWTIDVIDSLATKLERTNCSSISTGDPVRMTFGKGKHGVFSYMIFDKPLPDSTIRRYYEKFNDTTIDRRGVIVYSR